MKINLSKYPSLKIFKNGQLHIIFDEKDSIDENFLISFFPDRFKQFIGNVNDFSNIYLVSNPFYKSAGSIIDKMIDNKDICKEIIGESGTLLLGDMVVFYSVKMSPMGNAVMEFCSFVANTVAYFSLPKNTERNKQIIFTSKIIPQYALHGQHFSMMVQMLILFKKFAPLETQVVEPGKKIRDFECKYINETNSRITILNSLWFTNQVKSGTFKVRSHLRLQPKKKNGEWTKEIIWINEFEKSGYTAPARKLSHQ